MGSGVGVAVGSGVSVGAGVAVGSAVVSATIPALSSDEETAGASVAADIGSNAGVLHANSIPQSNPVDRIVSKVCFI